MDAHSPAPTDLSMHWLDAGLPPRAMRCPYCDWRGEFAHAKSFWHEGETLSMFACENCESLVYDLAGIVAPIVSDIDRMTPAAARAARYVIEAGFSSYYVASCGLAAIPDLPAEALREHLFVDVGAGMGMGSFFARSVLGIETLTIEPSYTGRLAAEMFGLRVHRAYFEDLSPEIMARLAAKTCLLHLNSVIEHLVDPAAVLTRIVEKIAIERVAIIVPDGAALDFAGPFVAALPFLAPRDHRHLPTIRGIELLLARVGFAFQATYRSAGVLIAIGAHQPIVVPSERGIKCAESLFLEHMLRHPHPQVAAGGAARLLANAVTNADANLMAVLRGKLSYHARVEELLGRLAEDDWEAIPFHLGPSCYWLAFDAVFAGRAKEALDLLRITEAFADKMADADAERAMTALEFKWAGLLLRAEIARHLRRPSMAMDVFKAVIDSRRDPQNGARRQYREQAEGSLRALEAALAL